MIITTIILAKSLFIDRGAYNIHVASMGNGKPMVALSGGPGFSGQAVWAIGYEMRDVSRVLLFDQAGTGRSLPKLGKTLPKLSIDQTIEDLEAVRKGLGYKKWDVFGQSWGTLVAGLYVTKYPNSVDRLCLASIPGLDMDDYLVLGQNIDDRVPQEYESETRKMLYNLSEEERYVTRIMRDSIFYFYYPDSAKELVQAIPPNILNGKLFATMYSEINQKNFDRIKLGLRKWKGKTLIQHGHQDPTGGAMGYKWATYLQHPTVKMYNQCGHFSWLEPNVTNRFFTDMREFLGYKRPIYMEPEMLGPRRAALDLKRKLDGWPFGYLPNR